MRINKKILKTFLTLGILTSLTHNIANADWIYHNKKQKIISTNATINNQQEKFILKKKFVVSYYTDLTIENSHHGSVDAQGNELIYTTAACNQLEFGTKVYIDGVEYTIRDRGNTDKKYFGEIKVDYLKEFMRIDILIERNKGETTNEYYHRVNMMGKPTLDGYIIIDRKTLDSLNFMCPIVTKEDYLKWLETEEGERSLKFNPYEGVN